jgi:hypothetical protein
MTPPATPFQTQGAYLMTEPLQPAPPAPEPTPEPPIDARTLLGEEYRKAKAAALGKPFHKRRF